MILFSQTPGFYSQGSNQWRLPETWDLKSFNHKITEEGSRNFFQALDNMPHLKELFSGISLNVSAQATNIKSVSESVYGEGQASCYLAC